MNTTTKAMKILGESVENDIEEIQEAKEYSIGKVKLAVYDNGGETADRYTIVPKGEGYKERNGMVEMIGASENPTSPTGVYQHSEGQVGKHLGKRIDFEKLPEALQKALKDEFKEDIAEAKDEKVTMNNLDWGKTTEERNKNLEKYNSLKTDTEKENFMKELKGITEACSGKKEEFIKEGETEIDKLKIFIDNDGDLYRQQKVPMYKNLSKKMIKGTYDKELAKKLMMYLVEAGAKKYAKEAGPNAVWHEMFSMADRKQVASELVDDFEDAFKNKEYDFMKDKDEKKVVKEGTENDLEEFLADEEVKKAFKLSPELKTKIEALFSKIDGTKKVVKEEVVKEATENTPIKITWADGKTMDTEYPGKLGSAKDYYMGKLFQNAMKIMNKPKVAKVELREVVSEADSKKTKLDFLRSRLASESGNDKKETEKEIEELEKDEVDKDNINETKDYTMDMCSEDIHDDEAKKKRSEELKTKFAEPLKYAKELETELQSIFPDSLVHMGYSTLGGGLSVNYELLMGKDKSEWANGISHNDPVQYVLWLHDLGDNDGKLVNNIEVTANQNSVLAKPTDKYSAYSRIKLPFRKKSGSPEQIKKYIIDLYKKVKDTLKQNIDNFTDEHKELISKKIK